jgi:mycofactocin glycosyltransferase
VLDERHPWTVAPISASGWSVAAWALAALGGPVGVAAGATTALSTAALLESKLGSLAAPRTVAWRLALRGHWGVGRLLAGAVWRAWLPLFLIVAIWSKRARWILLVSLILPGTTDWAQTPRPLDLVRYLALRAVDDAAYCSGVWQGCLPSRRFRALFPHLANWPGPSHTGRVD